MWKLIRIEELKDPDLATLCLEIEEAVFGKRAWNLELLKQELSNSFSLGLLLKREDLSMGYILGRRMEEEGEILRIAVKREFQNQGLGKLLLISFLKKLAHNKVQRVFLEVSSQNLKAFNFYLKNGFEIIGKRKDYYGLGESALIMVKSLKDF